ncbi:phosphotransferase [Saccharopolyspora erythraea]|uniref:phosphotransferase n=1 Tax=Saccharopolyspora erythraea TaxID=1836 RepID=UPI001BAB582F|nr:phosphotransferase [Saccharopolyspora erythraea]QUH01952.1 phosphotransferase [Saccharopolyspora erythraea]
MSCSPVPGSALWVREVLEQEWRPRSRPVVRPLSGGLGEPPLTHTAGLWACASGDRSWVFKAQLNPDAVRDADFYPLKQGVVEHCVSRGVPAARAIPTASGAPIALRDGVVCELLPRYSDAAPHGATAEQVAEVVRTALRLRHALDEVSRATVEDLARMPVNPLVDQPDWALALGEVEDLLKLAEARDDDWAALAGSALREVLDTEPLLAEAPAPRADSAVHADLHRHHFLLRSGQVEAILDFDNLRAGDRLLDLAWTAELCLSAPAPEDPAGPESLREFARRCVDEELLEARDLRRLMPALLVFSLPVLVDIAKDILQRDILSPVWQQYFHLLSPARRARVHKILQNL